MYAAERTDFQDVQIITLKQWLYEQAHERAWALCYLPHEVATYAENLLITEYTHAREFVNIYANGIQVGINTIEVDDTAIDRAIMMLSEVDSFTTERRIEFGKRLPINATTHPSV